MQIKEIIPHAKKALNDRFGLKELPKKRKIFVKSLSNNRKLYRLKDTPIYFIWRKSDKKIITFLTEDMVKKGYLIIGKKKIYQTKKGKK